MPLMDNAALGIVVLAGLYLLALGTASLVAPDRARRFLSGFADSLGLHLLELAVRFVVGSAFVGGAPRMALPEVFRGFGWVLIGTTVCLLAIPWRWHRRFALRSVPRATRHIAWIGAASLALGIFVLAAVARGALVPPDPEWWLA